MADSRYSSISETSGIMALPESFSQFSEQQKKRWLSSVPEYIYEGSGAKNYIGVSVTKEQLKYIDDDFINMFCKYNRGKNLSVDVSHSGLFTSEEFNKLVQIREKLRKNNCDMFFEENLSYYSFERVATANQKINSWIDEINNLKIDGKNLSPLEKYIVAYNYVTQFVYNESRTNLTESRNLISVLTGKNIVCVGYAQLLKELCQKLGIECEVQNIAFESRDSNHMNCCVKIADEKYGLNGIFYSDPCFDSNENGTVSIANSLICYNDLNALYGYKVRFKNDEFEGRRLPTIDNIVDNKSQEQLNADLSQFMNSDAIKNDLMKYVDDSISDKKDNILVGIPTKKALRNVIDLYIANKLRYDFMRDEKLKNIVNSPVMQNINKDYLSNVVLAHSRKGNIDNFKGKLLEELKTYLPSVESEVYEFLTDSYKNSESSKIDKKLDDEKVSTKNLGIEEFLSLMQNLSRMEGNTSANINIGKLIINSAFRANKRWGEFKFCENPISKIANYYTIKIRDFDDAYIHTGNDLLNYYVREELPRELKRKQYLENKAKEKENNIQGPSM